MVIDRYDRAFYMLTINNKMCYADEDDMKDIKRKRELNNKILSKKINMNLLDIVTMIRLLNDMITKKEKWYSKESYERNKEILKHELFIINAVAKIKDQLMVYSDLDLILTQQEMKHLDEIDRKLVANGVHLKHSLTCIERNKRKRAEDVWAEKFEKEKLELSKSSFGREFE